MKKEYIKPFVEIIGFNSKEAIMNDNFMDADDDIIADGSIGDFDW